jgi:SPASM domain peptide maturase of grasp-with-spasm system
MSELTNILAANCIFTKGSKRHLLIDLQKLCWYHIDFDIDNVDNINQEDLDFLKKEGVIIQIPDSFINNFTPLSKKYISPFKIETCIIDYIDSSRYKIEDALKVVIDERIKFVELRFYKHCSNINLKKILQKLKSSDVESIDIVLPFSNSKKPFDFEDYPKVSRIIYHSTKVGFKPSNKEFVYYTSEIITNSKNCGQISPLLFTANRNHVLKSLNFNSCLYKKIGIDVDGNVKNCPSMSNTRSVNLSNFSLEKIHCNLAQITKDKIKTCKDCEFRHVCTDCRVYLEDPNDIYSKPLKCGYDPYLGTWSDWKTDPKKQDAIKFYNL